MGRVGPGKARFSRWCGLGWFVPLKPKPIAGFALQELRTGLILAQRSTQTRPASFVCLDWAGPKMWWAALLMLTHDHLRKKVV